MSSATSAALVACSRSMRAHLLRPLACLGLGNAASQHPVLRGVKNLLVNLTISIVSLLVFGSLIEGVLRVAGFKPEQRVVPEFSWKEKGELWLMPAGATWRTREGNHPVHINAYGLRDREIGPCEPALRRVLVLGDSVTFGHGQSIQVTFVRELERLLSADAAKVQVVNAGIPGWSTRQQLRFYQQYGVKLCPDLVLVGFVLNDIRELANGVGELRAGVGLRGTQVITWLSQHAAAFAAFKRLYVRLLNPAAAEIRAVEEVVYRSDTPEVRHAMDLVRQDLKELIAVTRERGDRFGLVLFPFRFQLKADGLDAPQARLRTFAKEEGVPVLDTLPLLRQYKPEEVLMDHDHFTPGGHRVVAQAIAEWIRRESLLPARQ